MSLYTFAKKDLLPRLTPIAGLHIEESTDLTLLSQMGEISQEEVIKRLANDHLAFVAYINNRPAAFGWMARGKAKIGELNHELVLPQGNRYLWNFRTLSEFRGRGIYPALLQFILRYEGNKAEQFWIIHAPENQSSLKGIMKAGFQYVGKLYTKKDGHIKIEATRAADACKQLLHAMDIQLSIEIPASCWNCSSPYLKKRMPQCCCSQAARICTDNTALSVTI
jgi:GNAT superfamily N-acetyltransferase